MERIGFILRAAKCLKSRQKFVLAPLGAALWTLGPCLFQGSDFTLVGRLEQGRRRAVAGGWAQDGAVSEQIEASLQDELARMQAQKRPSGESLSHCAECEEAIPEKRRLAIPGVKLCIDCQQERDGMRQARGGINRRGSKDSQLK